jgi:hypothetical protein
MEMRPRVSSQGASGILTEIAFSTNNRRLRTHPLFNASRGPTGHAEGRGVPA